MKAPGSPVSFQQRTAQKAPRERSAGARRGPLRAASATASGAPESRRPSLRGEGVSLLPLEALLSEGPGVLRCQVAFRPDGQREDGPGVASQKLPQRASAATPAGPGRAGWTHHLPAWETPRPHATRRTRLRAHACSTPGERAGALLLPPRRRVSGRFHVTTLVHRP